MLQWKHSKLVGLIAVLTTVAAVFGQWGWLLQWSW